MTGSQIRQGIGDAVATLRSRLDREILDYPAAGAVNADPLSILAARAGSSASYGSYDAEFLSRLSELQERSSKHLQLSLRSLLLQILAARLDTLPDEGCSDYVRLFTLRNFRRILAEMKKQATSRYDIANDVYRKDLALVVGRLFPIGSYFIESGSGIPRSLVYRKNLRQALVFLWMWLRTRTLKGYYQVHLNLSDLAFFNERGSRDFYYICAEELRLNPDVTGVIRSSWFMDPAMERVGGNLVHLTMIPMEHGATRYKYMDDVAGESGALAFSPVRRKLFDEGHYLPAYYLLAWHRRQMLEWFGQQTDAPELTIELADWPD